MKCSTNQRVKLWVFLQWNTQHHLKFRLEELIVVNDGVGADGMSHHQHFSFQGGRLTALVKADLPLSFLQRQREQSFAFVRLVLLPDFTFKTPLYYLHQATRRRKTHVRDNQIFLQNVLISKTLTVNGLMIYVISTFLTDLLACSYLGQAWLT